MEFMEWIRGPMVGRGSSATVNLVKPVNFSSYSDCPIMVVKSTEFTLSESLKTENQVLLDIGNCEEVVKCFGESISYENGNNMYNLFFEYAERGSLENCRRNLGGKFKECDVRRYTRSILKGLSCIHDKEYVHCDIKLENILLFNDGTVKIADFGLATKIEDKKRQLRGTPLYMSPELVTGGEMTSSVDIWALGFVVVKMISGKSAWEVSLEGDVNALIYQIGFAKKSPEIPKDLCLEGRDFVEKCFIRDPNKRWTARMLLDHPFVNGFDEEISVSPRDPFQFLDLEYPGSLSSGPYEFSGFGFGKQLSLDPFRDESGIESLEANRSSGCVRIEEMACDVRPEWSNSDGWIVVR